VLLVDDNAMNLVLAQAHLGNLGCEVTVAGDGEAALAAAGAFDLILMDCQMPVMDGFEATRRLRERERGGGVRTPVVAMTANAMASDREACLAAGMDDFLPKPYSKAELVGVLERWLGRRAVAAPAAVIPALAAMPPAVAAGGGATVAPVAAVEADAEAVLDRAPLQRLLEGHPRGAALVTQLLELFWENGEKQLAQIDAALTGGDDATLIRAAHTLKSSSATVGAARLAGVSRRIELAARAGERAGLAAQLAAARSDFAAARAAQAQVLKELRA
jgi:CheY-like chemotaxis protein